MYIYLRYGDGEKTLLNPDCTTRNLLEFVRCKCACIKTSIVDLCDESGQVKNLHEFTDMDSPMSILEDKATYIPILIEKNEENSSKSFLPLLQQYEDAYPDLKKKLHDQCTNEDKQTKPHRKRSDTNTTAKGRNRRDRDTSANKRK